MWVISDVHAAYDALRDVAARCRPLLVLGDLVNLVDYRTGEGVLADVFGRDFVEAAIVHRATGNMEAARALWHTHLDGREAEIRAAIRRGIAAQYERVGQALADARAEAYVTYGNVDAPDLLQAVLPDGCRFLDGEVVEIEGWTVGFAGGGRATPLQAPGEVTDEVMGAKLARIGRVDILATHLPPTLRPVRLDVVTGREERGSRPILDHLLATRPRYHLFGDVHQPQAVTWRLGPTRLRNVGYFRATRRPFYLHPAAEERGDRRS